MRGEEAFTVPEAPTTARPRFSARSTAPDGVQRAEVRFDGIAGCLRTPKGGSSRQTVMVVENGAIRSRLLSPREAARLMGVAETFWLPEKYNDAYRAMGDGVVVPVVRWLSERLLLPLADHIAASRERAPARGRYALASNFRRNIERRTAEWLRGSAES